MVTNYKSTDLRTRLARHHSNVDAMFSAWSNMWLYPCFESFDLTRELRLICVPMLIVKSEDDPYSTMAQVRVAETECRCLVETVVIPGVGHSPHRSNPKRTLEAMVNFT
jgi:pimeloyl-ACP methyl ester carboxylesterase